MTASVASIGLHSSLWRSSCAISAPFQAHFNAMSPPYMKDDHQPSTTNLYLEAGTSASDNGVGPATGGQVEGYRHPKERWASTRRLREATF